MQRCNNTLGFYLVTWGSNMTSQCDHAKVWEKWKKWWKWEWKEYSKSGGVVERGWGLWKQREGPATSSFFSPFPSGSSCQLYCRPPFCVGTSPWQSLVSVGDWTHTRKHAEVVGVTTGALHGWDSSKLTSSHHTSRQGGTLYLLNYTHASAHTVSHIPSHPNVFTQTRTHQWFPPVKLAPSQNNLGRVPRFNLPNSFFIFLDHF